MKRIGNLYQQICSLENLRLADSLARKGKMNQYGVKIHTRNQEANILLLQEMLINKTYCTSAYKHKTIIEEKVREISILPYFPDRIAHHAVMNVLEPMFVSVFTRDTYSCIKGRGIHALVHALIRMLKDEPATVYCLKIDVKKFYPNVDHEILKQLLRRKFKDQDLLWLLDEIIDSAPGLPIGNYLSQYFANFYLAYFDHWIKEELGVKYYARYLDDMVFFSGNKPELHQLLAQIREYLDTKLKLEIKKNYQVFPVPARGVDMGGIRFYHKYRRWRKRIKKNFARAVASGNTKAIPSYLGWMQYFNSTNLINKILKPNENIQRAGGQIKKPDR